MDLRRCLAEHWDDLLRLAGSLKLGVVQATSIMRTLQISDRPTKLAQAVAELGRIDKTFHALTYIDAALTRLRAEGYSVRDEDVARLSPLVFEHINLLGRYAFSVPEAVTRGELRPLRNPADALEEVA